MGSRWVQLKRRLVRFDGLGAGDRQSERVRFFPSSLLPSQRLCGRPSLQNLTSRLPRVLGRPSKESKHGRVYTPHIEQVRLSPWDLMMTRFIRIGC